MVRGKKIRNHEYQKNKEDEIRKKERWNNIDIRGIKEIDTESIGKNKRDRRKQVERNKAQNRRDRNLSNRKNDLTWYERKTQKTNQEIIGNGEEIGIYNKRYQEGDSYKEWNKNSQKIDFCGFKVPHLYNPFDIKIQIRYKAVKSNLVRVCT